MNYIKEWLMTFSMKPSLLSSKKLERFAMMSIVFGSIIACVIYEIAKDKLTAMEVTILTSPLLVAAGYNLSQTEKSKLTIKEVEEKENGES